MSILLKWGKWSCPRVKSVPVSTACYSSEGHCSWQSCLLSAAAMSSHKHCGECGKETLHPNRYPACQSIDATPLSTGVSRWISVLNSLWIPLNSWRPRSFAPFKSLFWPKLTTLSPERYSFIHPFIHSFIFFFPPPSIYNASVLEKSIKMSDFSSSLYHYRCYKLPACSEHSKNEEVGRLRAASPFSRPLTVAGFCRESHRC